MPSGLAAQRPGSLKGLYGSFNAGLGIVSENVSGLEKNISPHFTMNFNLGVFICKSLQAGVTANGWLFESFGPIPFAYKGESISNTMIHLQVYPVKNNRFFMKGAYGVSKYINLRPEGNYGKGDGYMFAIGYEKEVGIDKFLSGIQLSVNLGKIRYYDSPGNNDFVNQRFQTVDLTFFMALD